MQAGCHRFDPGQLHHFLFEGIEANQLEVESLHHVNGQTLILELVAHPVWAAGLQRASVARSSNMKLPRTIFDN